MFINSLTSGWESQKASKRKGLLMLLPGLFHFNSIGQWSDPENGMMWAVNSPPMWMALSEIRNRSRREAICSGATRLFVQVYRPLALARQSTNCLEQNLWVESCLCWFYIALLVFPLLKLSYWNLLPLPKAGMFYQCWAAILFLELQLSAEFLVGSKHLWCGHEWLCPEDEKLPEWSFCLHGYCLIVLSPHPRG